MMKCDDCPLMHGQGCPKASPITEDSSKVRCPVTPANMTIIEAMIAGKFDCGRCEFTDEYRDIEDMRHGIYCIEHDERKTRYAWPCEKWQPRKDDGDGN